MLTVSNHGAQEPMIRAIGVLMCCEDGCGEEAQQELCVVLNGIVDWEAEP